MKSFVVLAGMLGSFALLVQQFSFWSVVGVAYMVAMALVVLFALTHRSSDKKFKKTQIVGSKN